MKFNYSNDSKTLIESLKNFDIKDFENWYINNNIYISINDYMQFIIYLKDEKIKLELLNKIQQINFNNDLKFEFNENLKIIIENSNINIEDFKKFYYLNFINIGSISIFYYLNSKKRSL